MAGVIRAVRKANAGVSTVRYCISIPYFTATGFASVVRIFSNIPELSEGVNVSNGRAYGAIAAIAWEKDLDTAEAGSVRRNQSHSESFPMQGPR
jgi:hypothetical protein